MTPKEIIKILEETIESNNLKQKNYLLVHLIHKLQKEEGTVPQIFD